MGSSTFPDDPCRRKVVLVFTEHDIERCLYEPGAGDILINEEACVLQYPITVEVQLPAALEYIVHSNLARPGTLLVQSPYNRDVYDDATSALQSFSVAKYMIFTRLCQHLGAQEVTVEQIDLRTRTRTWTVDLRAEHPRVEGSMSVESEELEKLHTQINVRSKFSGGRADVLAAERLLKSTGLMSDQHMSELLELRREDNPNVLSEHELAVSLSSEAKRNLKVAATLQIPSFVNLTADYNKSLRAQHDYSVTISVRF